MRVATLEDDGWELLDGELQHKKHPETFLIPSKDEIADLKVGDVVKLHFMFWENDNPESNRVTVERMWVTITSILGNDITGLLDNSPVRSAALAMNDPIRFNPENVCSIYIKATDPRHTHYNTLTHNKLLQRIKKSFAFFFRLPRR